MHNLPDAGCKRVIIKLFLISLKPTTHLGTPVF